MPTQATLFEASLFAAVGLVLALATMRIAPALRRTMAIMVVVMVAGMLGLYALAKLGGPAAETTMAIVVRELAFLLVAIGVTLVLLNFLCQAVFAQARRPRNLADGMLVL